MLSDGRRGRGALEYLHFLHASGRAFGFDQAVCECQCIVLLCTQQLHTCCTVDISAVLGVHIRSYIPGMILHGNSIYVILQWRDPYNLTYILSWPEKMRVYVVLRRICAHVLWNVHTSQCSVALLLCVS